MVDTVTKLQRHQARHTNVVVSEVNVRQVFTLSQHLSQCNGPCSEDTSNSVSCHRAVLSCHRAVLSWYGAVLSCYGAVLSCYGAVLSCHGAVLGCHRAVLGCHGAPVLAVQ